MWVKFLRSYAEFVPGDVAKCEAGSAQSLIRHGVAVAAPDDLIPRLRKPEIETAMAEPAPEHRTERRG